LQANRCKKCFLLNADTLCCEFYRVAKNSYDIKLEISSIIGWFTRALFQENTEDFRLSQAKKIISEIENALREI